MLCTQSSGKTIGILADPKTRIGGILQWVGLAACKAPLPLALSFWLTPPHCRSVQYRATDICKTPPLHLYLTKSLPGCGVALVWSATLYRVPRVGHCGDGGPRVSSLEERGLACSVGRPIFESEMALRADLGL